MTETDLRRVTREVWSNYVNLNTTKYIFNALVDKATYAPLRLLCYGKQGSGKTTFAFYSVKVAYTMYLCHNVGVPKDKCLEYAMDKYNLCLGRDCLRDVIDGELMSGFYVTVDDLVRRFLEDVASGEIANKRIVFFDDAFTPKIWWTQGGPWRKLYIASKQFDMFYRDRINVLVMTAPNLRYFTWDYVTNSLVLEFTAKLMNGYPYTIATHYRYPLQVRYDFGEPYLVRLKQIDFVDRVPFRKAYGLPRWLEELNTERRQYVLKQAIEEALRAIREEEESRGRRGKR